MKNYKFILLAFLCCVFGCIYGSDNSSVSFPPQIREIFLSVYKGREESVAYIERYIVFAVDEDYEKLKTKEGQNDLASRYSLIRILDLEYYLSLDIDLEDETKDIQKEKTVRAYRSMLYWDKFRLSRLWQEGDKILVIKKEKIKDIEFLDETFVHKILFKDLGNLTLKNMSYFFKNLNELENLVNKISKFNEFEKKIDPDLQDGYYRLRKVQEDVFENLSDQNISFPLLKFLMNIDDYTRKDIVKKNIIHFERFFLRILNSELERDQILKNFETLNIFFKDVFENINIKNVLGKIKEKDLEVEINSIQERIGSISTLSEEDAFKALSKMGSEIRHLKQSKNHQDNLYQFIDESVFYSKVQAVEQVLEGMGREVHQRKEAREIQAREEATAREIAEIQARENELERMSREAEERETEALKIKKTR